MRKSPVKSFLLILAFLIAFFGATKTLAGNFGGLETTAGAAKLTGITSVQSFIGNIVGAVLSLISVVFFMFMLYAGIRWMTARGNEEAEKQARDTILGGAIGMIIIMSAYALTNLVFNAATQGGTLTGGGAGTGNVPTATAGKWCFTAENTCVKNNICEGMTYDTEAECKTNPDFDQPTEIAPISETPLVFNFCILQYPALGNYVCHQDTVEAQCKDTKRYTSKKECEDDAQKNYGLENKEVCLNNLQCKSNRCGTFTEICTACNYSSEVECGGSAIYNECLLIKADTNNESGLKICY